MAKQKKGEREQDVFEREKNKKPQTYVEELNKSADSAKRMDVNFQSLREIIRHGNIDVTKNRILNGMGIDYENWLTTDEGTQLKLIRDQFPNVVKKFAGAGRVLDKEFESFTKTFPSLLQTIEGQLKLVDFQALENQIPMIKNAISKKMASEYQNRGESLPQDFELRVDIASEPQVDQIYERMHQVMAPGSPPLETLRNSEFVVDKDGNEGIMPANKVEAAIKSGRYKRA